MKKRYQFRLPFTQMFKFVLARLRILLRSIVANSWQQRLKTCFLFFIAFALTDKTFSQNEKLFRPPSPQSQEFIKYGDYPVSNYTGVPDISIPIHQVNFYGYTMPISLKYHASGIKVGGHVDPAGLGWTLFSGGEISRTVRCVPDESMAFMKGIYVTTVDPKYYRYLKDLTEGYPGSSPDVGDVSYDDFNVTLPNGTFFRFYISNIGGVYKVSTNPAPLGVKITFDYNGAKGSAARINSFTIIDEQGVKYEFLDSELSEPGKFGWTYKTTWKLTRITLPHTDKIISFTYRSAHDVIIPKKNYTRVIRDSNGRVSCGPCMFSGYGGGSTECYYPAIGHKASWRIVDSYQDNSYNRPGLVLQSILFGDNSIVFNYDDYVLYNMYASKLNNIELNDVKKKVFFKQSSVGSGMLYTTLDELTIQGRQTNRPITYKFSYTSHILNGPFHAFDHWGYLLPGWINIGTPNDITVCPMWGSLQPFNVPDFETEVADPVHWSDTCLFQSWVTFPDGKKHYKTKIGNTSREPFHIPELMLNKIVYPTGGYTLFDFESNVYLSTELNIAQYTPNGGGYRIKTISSYANGSLSERKTYKYGKDECGYGFAPVEPSAKSYQKSYIDYDEYQAPVGFGMFGPESRYRERNFNSDNFTNLLGSLPPVVYEEVTEYIGDANNNTGKTVFKYNIMKRIPEQEGGYGSDYLQKNMVTGDYYVLKDDLWKYGQLVGKDVYKNENNTYKLIQRQEQEWEYPMLDVLLDRSGFYLYDRAIHNVGSSTDPFEQGVYKECFMPNVFLSNPHYIYTGKANLKVLSTRNYTDQLDSITTREYNSYNTYGRIAEKINWNSNGTTYKTDYKYPNDKNSVDLLNEALTTANMTALDTLVARNIVAPVIQERQLMGQNSVTTKRTDYLLFNNKPFPQSVKVKIDATAIEENIAYSQYDSYGNPVQFIGKDGIVTSLLWGYKGQYLVAKVAGADYSTASAAITQSILDNPSGDVALRTELNKLRAIANTFVTTYTYLPSVGINSETDPNGRSIYYQYDDLNRLTVIRDKDYNILKLYCYNYAGQPEDCSGITYTSTKSKTYTKACSVGGTSNTYTYTTTAISQLSPEDAEAMALADINNNGQGTADNYLKCSYYNDLRSDYFRKSNCSPGYQGSLVEYVVDANKHVSHVSKEDANNIAWNDVVTRGPFYADSAGTCSPQTIPVIGISSAPSDCYMVEFYDQQTGFSLWADIPNGGTMLGTIPYGNNYQVNIHASGWGCTGATRTYMIMYDGNMQQTTSNGYAQFIVPIHESFQLFIQ